VCVRDGATTVGGRQTDVLGNNSKYSSVLASCDCVTAFTDVCVSYVQY